MSRYDCLEFYIHEREMYLLQYFIFIVFGFSWPFFFTSFRQAKDGDFEQSSFFLSLIYIALEYRIEIAFTFLRVRTRFLGPMQHPLIMTKSCLTSPQWGNPPIGLIDLSAKSYSVEALFLINLPSLVWNPSRMSQIFLLISVR